MAIANLPQVNSPFLMDNPIFDSGQFQAMMQVAEVMAKAKLVPEHLQNKPADCLLVVEQSRRWNMSPFAVAQETYVVKGKLLFGGKLVTAVINSRAPVKSPLRFTFEDEDKGDQCKVTVTATLKGDDEPRTYSITIFDAKAVAGNSTLWKTDPKQQVCYFAARFWARRHCPETLLGVWSEDEISDKEPMRDVTPRDIRRSAAPPEEIVVVDPFGEELSLLPGELGLQVENWCRECTDEELRSLKENNLSIGLLVSSVDGALEIRMAKKLALTDAEKDAAAEGIYRGPDDDPLNLRNVKGAMGFLETLRLGLEKASAIDADRYWQCYRDRAKQADLKVNAGDYTALEALVAARIASGRSVS